VTKESEVAQDQSGYGLSSGSIVTKRGIRHVGRLGQQRRVPAYIGK